MIKQFIGLVLLSFCLLIDAKEYDSPAKNIEELKSRLNEMVEYYDAPGLSVAIVDKHTHRLVAGFGLADKQTNKPASAETLFRMGSISKMFVSLAALKLEEQGKLDLQTPLKQLVPDIEFENPWQDTHPVRLIHLLEHTAGWDDIHLAEYANNDPTPLTLKQALDYHPDSRVSRWRPGERMSYSNSGPAVAAYAIEKVTGTDFETYVRQHFFQPLGMSSASYRYPEQDHLLATLYQDGEVSDYWHIAMRPSGSINASARDMANFVQFFINRGVANGDRLLSQQSIQKMETPHSSIAANANMKTGYGLGNYTSHYKNFVFHGHSGGVNGGVARLAYLANEGVGFGVMMNSDKSYAFKPIYKEIQRYITFGMSGPKRPEIKPISEKIAEQYTGYYRQVNPRQALFGFTSELMGTRFLTVKTDIAGWGEISHSANLEQDKTTDNKDSNADKDGHYYPVGDNLFRQKNNSEATFGLLKDQDGLAVQVGTQYWQKISAFDYYATKWSAFLFIATVVLNVLWFFVWGIRRLNKKIEKGPAMTIRWWPFIAAASIVGMLILLTIGQLVDIFKMLGEPSFISMSILILSIVFPISAVVGLIQSIRFRKADINRFAKIFCFISSLVFVLSIGYLLPAGLIGLATFSY